MPLVHLVGFLIGAALYGLLFVLVVRRRLDDRLPLLTAVLGLIWNVIGLAAYGIRDLAGHDPHPYLIATAYSALGFLPAVVVDSVLRPRSGRAARIFVVFAYGVSTAAEALMFWSAGHGVAPSAAALKMLTWSYAAIAIPVLVLTRRGDGPPRRWSVVALAVFAISALHLSHSEGPHEPWFVELVGHHASVPLIFAILYQDFRFALADLFLKRALALFSLLAIASALYLGVEVPLLRQHDFQADPVAVGVSVMLWAGMALLYPPLRRGAAWIVDRVILHRADYARVRDDIARRVAEAGDPDAVMRVLAEALRGPLAAEAIRVVGGTDGDVAIPTSDEPRYALLLGPLSGGRRLLSDELEMLDAVALMAARRIDALRLAREREEMTKLTTQAELRALRAQVNPHFLFNALNTIGYLIQTAPARAHATLMKLTSLLRGVLRSGEMAIALGDEIDLVAAYLDIERARFEERLQVEIDVPDALRRVRVPALIVQPLVENAIKHGIANSRGGGSVVVRIRAEREHLVIAVRNTGLPTSELEIAHGRRRGVGLANLDARLRHLYGDAARLALTATPNETCAEIVLPALARDVA
jgi:two-component system LytT family sensor kinase